MSDRLSIRIDDDTAEALARLTVKDRTQTEVVRRAVALLDVAAEQESKGMHLEFVSENGKTRNRAFMLY